MHQYFCIFWQKELSAKFWGFLNDSHCWLRLFFYIILLSVFLPLYIFLCVRLSCGVWIFLLYKTLMSWSGIHYCIRECSNFIFLLLFRLPFLIKYFFIFSRLLFLSLHKLSLWSSDGFFKLLSWVKFLSSFQHWVSKLLTRDSWDYRVCYAKVLSANLFTQFSCYQALYWFTLITIIILPATALIAQWYSNIHFRLFIPKWLFIRLSH